MILAAEEILLPAKFLTLMGQWIVSLTLALDRENVAANNLADGDSATRNKAMLYSLAFLAVIVGSVEVISVMVGFTMFMRVWSSMQAVVHFLGFVLLCIFIDAHWSTTSLAAIVLPCCVAPCAVECFLALLATRFRFKRW